MCGICGIVDYNKSAPVTENTLRKMCSALSHRGPDDQGVNIVARAPFAGLGHRRLSIIDLTVCGHQPMSNETGRIWIVFNGEIYNHRQLKSSLEAKGHRFKSQTDSEVIIHLYEEIGSECVNSLRGMFAFGIWDSDKNELCLARDRAGKKPLVYYAGNNRFTFASELSALLEDEQISRQINLEALDYYFTFGYIPAPATIYKNIYKLPPAHTLMLKNNEITIQKYWQLDFTRKLKISENDAAVEIISRLKEAVSIRLYSDVPLGAFLSGGIDSSTIVGLMSGLTSSKVKTFSIGFAEKDYSELEFARNVAVRFGTEHREFIVRPDALEVLPLLIERYGEPYADSSSIPTYYVSQQTRQFVTVALNGDGGDEIFAGYERYQAMIAADLINRLPGFLKYPIFKIGRALPDSIQAKNNLRKIKRFVTAANLPEVQRYLKWVSIFDPLNKEALYSRKLAAELSLHCVLTWFTGKFNDFKQADLIERLLGVDLNTYLAYDLLVKVDIASMANSLEARSPFLDHEFMEFAAQLPAQYKMKNLVKKYLLKKAIRGFIPKENVYRRKMGFGVPVGEWFRHELKDYLRGHLLNGETAKTGYFSSGFIKHMLDEHISAKYDYTAQLWSLLMFELWYMRFMK